MRRLVLYLFIFLTTLFYEKAHSHRMTQLEGNFGIVWCGPHFLDERMRFKEGR
jgi:hypothetical protein